jgi:hypothetical protein
MGLSVIRAELHTRLLSNGYLNAIEQEMHNVLWTSRGEFLSLATDVTFADSSMNLLLIRHAAWQDGSAVSSENTLSLEAGNSEA